MTRKHFEAIAARIKHQLDLANASSMPMNEKLAATSAVVDLAIGLAAEFGKFNPYFDGDRFLKACGIDGPNA